MNGEPKRSAIGDQRSAMPKLSALSSQLSARARRGVPAHLDSSFIPHPSALQRAFTLTELLVSLVILVGMMTLIAMIFSTAGKSSGVARAQARLHRQLLQAADTMRIDLANTLTGTGAGGAPQGVLAIAGVAADAADTPKSIIRPHRADVLMLLTQQRFEPFAYYPVPPGAMFDQYKQVVYGHADLGKLNSTGGWIGTVKRVENSVGQWYASEWHLARRVVGFRKLDANDPPTSYPALRWPPTSSYVLGTDPNGVMTDVIYDVWSPEIFLSQIHPGFYAYEWSSAKLAEFYLESEPPYYCSRDGVYYILHAESPDLTAYWWRQQQFNTNQWIRQGPSGQVGPIGQPPLSLAVVLNYQAPPGYRFWPDWFFNPAATGGNSYRTRLDPMPPPGMPARTAAYFMPSCSEFKVEYTYDDPREIVVDPATAQPVLVDLNDDGTLDAPAASPVNWQTVPPGEIYVWTGLSTDPSVYDTTDPAGLRNRTFPFRWPRALRITIRAYAPGGALDYPIEHSLVHVWK